MKYLAYPTFIAVDYEFEPVKHRKLVSKAGPGIVTQSNKPFNQHAVTHWVVYNGRPLGLGISLGKHMEEESIELAIEHETIHDVIARIENVQSGWEFDNTVYADYQRILMYYPPQIYTRDYIDEFFSKWS